MVVRQRLTICDSRVTGLEPPGPQPTSYSDLIAGQAVEAVEQ
jgi:hypothetical protein